LALPFLEHFLWFEFEPPCIQSVLAFRSTGIFTFLLCILSFDQMLFHFSTTAFCSIGSFFFPVQLFLLSLIRYPDSPLIGFITFSWLSSFLSIGLLTILLVMTPFLFGSECCDQLSHFK
jgi:hypothetical protein